MIVENMIWAEMLQCKVNVQCILDYNDRQRKFQRCYAFIVAISAAIGALSYFKEPLITFVSSLFIALTSIIKAIFPHFLQSEQELCELDGLIDYYNQHLTVLEDLYYKLDKGKIDEDGAEIEITKLKHDSAIKVSRVNKLIRKLSDTQRKKYQEEAIKYFKQVYNIETNER